MRNGEYLVSVLDVEGLRRLDATRWDDLSANALDPNPFYARDYVLAGLSTIDREGRLQAVAIHAGDQGTLVGLFPFQLRQLPFAMAMGAANLYQMCGHPLVHRDHAESVIAVWLDALNTGAVPRRWSFPHLDLDSGFAQLCDKQRDDRAIDIVPLGAYARAGLKRLGGGFDEHVATVISRRRVKDIQRTLRRLAELGEVRFERATEPELVAERVDAFLTMEHAGWKGNMGTSFLSDTEHTEFARQAFANNATTSVDSLLLDGRPIAISINAHSGTTIFTPKCAYDETYRRLSPGLALEYLVIQAFYESDDDVEMDAATTVSGHLMEGLWNVEKTMAPALIGPNDWSTRLVAGLHVAAMSSRGAAKSLLANRFSLQGARRGIRRAQAVLRWLLPWGRGVGCLILYI